MTHVDTGIYGAKKTAFEYLSPESLLKRLMEKYPRAGVDELRPLFTTAIERSKRRDDYREVIDLYFVANGYTRLRKPNPDEIKAAKDAREKAERQAALITAAIEQLAEKSRLIDSVMPNGKKWVDCTREEGMAFGGTIAKLSAMVEPGKIIGTKFKTEEQVRDALKLK